MFESRFQSFDVQSDPAQAKPRLAARREKLKHENLDGFIVPRADEHQNEYVPKCAERLAWLTGFTGSAGLAIVLGGKAALFVDGRYTLQARGEVDTQLHAIVDITRTPPSSWLVEHVKEGQRIGYDPWVHTPGQADTYREKLAAKGAELVAVATNPIDRIWTGRPDAPQGAIMLYPERLAGESVLRKLARIREKLAGADALLVSDPHALAWAFNIRGSDVAHTPLPLGYALIPAKGKPRLYLDGAKLSNSVRAKLSERADIEEPGRLADDLGTRARDKKVRFDAATAPAKLVEIVRSNGGTPEIAADPIALMKARKNAREIDGVKAAHLRDGVALVHFLAWFDRQAPKGKLTEIDAASALEAFRQQTGKLRDISFPTISATGAHAASPHYRVTRTSNARIGRGLFLIDSGAQYEDGTTDVTRTIAVGRPTREMRDRFTRVLKGHIAISRLVFPLGTSGAQIDALARQYLWAAGLDFDHGTGHGVGAYLSVHEGPQRISKIGHVTLEPGMILSNEPGYYKAGAYGIRIENLVVVAPRTIKGAEREMLGFDVLTLAPIDINLVEPKLMTDDESAWLDAYHKDVRTKLSPLVPANLRRWLTSATRRISEAGPVRRTPARASKR
ncbi:MAG: aminopeptidase P family protein [Methylobacteriaceae bacterium]|nr:aminopeptidase P family protein [Methylobacteriaceae bacterium]